MQFSSWMDRETCLISPGVRALRLHSQDQIQLIAKNSMTSP
jgi:hypothetical protein